MPTTITSAAGTVYHLWQLPDLTAPEPSESIAFNTLRNDLANGYSSQVLFGSNTGLRTWSLTLPTLASSDVMSNTVTGINGEAVSREQYVWDLYCESMVTGDPFVYQSPRNNQYYLVEFADEQLTYERARVKLYSTGITLRQVRRSGETVCDPGEFALTNSVLYWFEGDDYTDGAETWTANAGHDGTYYPSNSVTLLGSGDVNKVSNAQNGRACVRFSNTTNDGYVVKAAAGNTFYDIFIAMKMREATFSNNAGILTGDGGGDTQVLTGASGTALFTNPALTASAFTYTYNSIEYAQSNMVAPMNEWGIVHLRYTTGWNLDDGFQFGKNRNTAGTYAEMDLGEVIMSCDLLSTVKCREIIEYLTVKWGIT